MEAPAKLVSQVKVFGVSAQKNSAEEKFAKVSCKRDVMVKKLLHNPFET